MLLNTYFEKYGHKCNLNLNGPFEQVLKNKCCLRKWFMVHAVISQNYILFRSRPRSCAALRSEMLYQMEHYPYVLHPFSVITYYLDKIWMIVVCIWCLLAPFDIFEHLYPVELFNKYGTENMEILCSTMCFMDCFRRFFTGYIIKHCDSDEIVLEPKRIATRYLRSYFLVDFIGSSTIFFKAFFPHPKSTFDLILITCSMLRIFRVCSIIRVIINIMRFHKFNHNFIDIFHAFLSLCFVVHWVSCFSVVPCIVERQFDPDAYEWYDNILKPDVSFISYYIICCHRSISILTGTGYKFILENTKSENDMIYTIFTSVLGHIITLSIFAKVYETVNGMRSSSAKYEEMLNEISNYMNHHNISKPTKNKVKTYYAFKYHYSYFNEYELLAAIPSSLRQKILLSSAKVVLDNIDYFKKLPGPLLANIVSCLTKEIVLPGDVIFRSQEEGNLMYFLLCGTVAVFTTSGREICHLEDGSEFGECVVTNVNERRHVCTVQAIETSELFRLHANDFLALANYMPDLLEQINKMANQRKELTSITEERFLETYNKYLMLEEQKSTTSNLGRIESLF